MAQAAGGPLIKLPEYAPKAKVQVIHNSADTIAEVVDVWLNQVLIADDLAFRSATAFLDVPAIEQVTLAVKGPDSQDPYGPMFMKNYTLIEEETYIMVAEGILSQAGFEPPVEFDVALYTGAQEAANIVGRTDILVHHGSTDAPMVDIIEVGLGAGELVADLEYAEFSSYLELPTIDYILEVRDASDDDLLGTFRAPLQTAGLENLAITVVASGFIDPAVNSDGAPFGLWAAIPEGGPMIELPQYVPSALVQLIHNSPDAAASVVDVWLDDQMLLDDFAFRTATPFTYIPANNQITLAVCSSDSQDPGTPLWSQDYTLVEDEIYIMVADGIVSPEGYDPLTPFTLSVYTGAALEAAEPTNIDVLVHHGSTDAPEVTVDIHNLTTGLTQETIEGLAFGEFDGYVELPSDKFMISFTGQDFTRTFEAPIDELNLEGQSLSILASGFADPSVNSNGQAFGLLAVQTDGTTIMLTDVTGIDESLVNAESVSIYPNPANNLVNISFELNSKENISLEIMDMTGRLVKSADLGKKNAGVYNEKVDIQGLNQGMYLLNIRTLDGMISRKFFKN
jgi:hypothetical protein